MSEKYHSFTETLSLLQVNILRRLFEFKVSRITYDLDEILSDTQTPVKLAFSELTGYDFRDRKIDQWLALAHWAAKLEGVEFNDISKVEVKVWSDPEVLKVAQPNIPMQVYSRMAAEHNIDQAVVTTRVPELGKVTSKWLEKYYPWIDKKKIFIRDRKKSEGGMDGDIFKGLIVQDFGSELHFDDSVTSVAEVVRLSSATPVLFPRALERGRFRGIDRVIEFPNMDLWFSLFGLHQNV